MPHYDDIHDDDRHDRREDIPLWADTEAWAALVKADKYVPGTHVKEWQARQAPSIGARARAILNTLLYPPSYIAKCEEALALYLSHAQNADRRGFWRAPRRTVGDALKGVQHHG